jgi:integrase
MSEPSEQSEKEKKRRQRGQVIDLGDKTFGIRVPLKERGTNGRSKTHYETVRNMTEPQAYKHKEKLLARIDAGLFFTAASMKMTKFIDEWVAQKKLQGLKPDSIETYESIADIYIRPRMKHLELSGIRGAEVRDLYNALQADGLSTGTIKHVRRIMRMMMKDAKRWGYIQNDPSTEIPAPEGSEGRELKSLNLAQALTFVETCYQDFYSGMIFVFALSTGMRPKEYKGISWPHIKLLQQQLPDGRTIERGLAEVRRIAVKPKQKDWVFPKPKTKKSVRDIYFPAQLYHDLMKLKQEQDRLKRLLGSKWHDHNLVFPSGNGNPIEDVTLHTRFQRLCTRSELQGFTPYSLRYSYATLQLLGGERDKVIAETMGHKSVDFNKEIYQKVLPVMQEQASDTLEKILFSSVRTTLAQPVSDRIM